MQGALHQVHSNTHLTLPLPMLRQDKEKKPVYKAALEGTPLCLTMTLHAAFDSCLESALQTFQSEPLIMVLNALV